MMVVKIQQYFTKHLKISDAEAKKLNKEYYQSYGLALEGLVTHHKIGIPSPNPPCPQCVPPEFLYMRCPYNPRYDFVHFSLNIYLLTPHFCTICSYTRLFFSCQKLRIDPLAYNREVDDTLELDAVLKPSPQLTEFLSSIDTTKVKPWILTNAYINHAKRCLKLLDIERFFEGIPWHPRSLFRDAFLLSPRRPRSRNTYRSICFKFLCLV